MAMFKVLLVLGVAAFAAASAAEETKVEEKITEKKDVAMMMMVPGQMKYADDDGSYWPGKYDRSLPVVPTAYHSVVPAMSSMHPIPVMSPMHSAMFPYAYSHMPISRSFVF